MAIRSLKSGLITRSALAGNLFTDTGDFESIATVTVGAGGSSSIVFSSIPSTYTHLQLRGIATSASGRIGIAFNTDATVSNYNQHFTYGDGAAGSGYNANAWCIGYTPSSGSLFGAFVCDILDYGNTNKYKVWRSLAGEDQNGSGAVVMYSGLWRNTGAINAITIYGAETTTSGTINQFSHFALYGIKG